MLEFGLLVSSERNKKNAMCYQAIIKCNLSWEDHPRPLHHEPPSSPELCRCRTIKGTTHKTNKVKLCKMSHVKIYSFKRTSYNRTDSCRLSCIMQPASKSPTFLQPSRNLLISILQLLDKSHPNSAICSHVPEARCAPRVPDSSCPANPKN